ncbi:MAG: phage tail protein [Lachnospiraceae bacterium]|nr:phage tail protein [Lachnospiraceae bacterium]
MKYYLTRSGDTWDYIAKEVYGSEAYTSFLMQNNQEYLIYFTFPADIKLVIEDLPEETTLLPDWRS